MRLGLCYVLISLIMLTGCGFKPLHQATEQAVSRSVFITSMPERIGQLVRYELQERFKGDENSEYSLSVDLEEQIRYLAIQDDATASYGRLELTGYYKLSRGKELLDNDFVRTESSYTIVDSEYASLKAEEDARLKAASTLAERITRRILLKLNQD